MFKTLQDIKNAMDKDSRWLTIWPDGFWKLRKVKKTQSNAVQFDDDSWLFWENAKNRKVLKNGLVCFWDDEKTKVIMSYILIEGYPNLQEVVNNFDGGRYKNRI